MLNTESIPGGNTMVEFVKISSTGMLLEIKEVSDQYRDQPYDELTEK